MNCVWKLSIAALALSLAPVAAQAGGMIERPAPQRPSQAGGATAAHLSQDFAAMIATLVAAEQAAQVRPHAEANPFRKPRPRPVRDYAPKLERPVARSL